MSTPLPLSDLYGMRVVLSELAMVPGRVPRRRYRRVHGKRVPIRWTKRHGTVEGSVPGVLVCMGVLTVHPSIWPALRDAVEKQPQPSPIEIARMCGRAPKGTSVRLPPDPLAVALLNGPGPGPGPDPTRLRYADLFRPLVLPIPQEKPEDVAHRLALKYGRPRLFL